MSQDDRDSTEQARFAENHRLMHEQMRREAGGFNTLPCIICRKRLMHVEHIEGIGNQPDDGVVCYTHGNYGSTVFDEVAGHYLEFNICDECLVKAREQRLIGLTYKGIPPRIWTEGLEDSPEDEQRRNDAVAEWNRKMEEEHGPFKTVETLVPNHPQHLKKE